MSRDMSLPGHRTKIDLKLRVLSSHSRHPRGMADEYRTNDLRASHGFGSPSRVSSLCRALSRRLQEPELFCARPVSLPGFRATHVSRESARHRGLFASPASQALPHGHSRPGRAQYLGLCQRTSRLAHLWRFRAGPDPHRPRTLSRRTLGHRVRRHRSTPSIPPPSICA